MKKWFLCLLSCLLLVPMILWAKPIESPYEPLVKKLEKQLKVSPELSEVTIVPSEYYPKDREPLRITWDNPNDDYEQIVVDILNQKQMVGYKKQYKEGQVATRQMVPGDESLKIAWDFIKTYTAFTQQDLKLSSNFVAATSNPEGVLTDDTIHYYFQLMYKGIPILGDHVAVTVDLKYGEVIYFDGDTYSDTKKFLTNQVLVSEDTARGSFIKNMDRQCMYSIYKDKVLPTYVLTNRFDRCIDAHTGELILPFNRKEEYESTKDIYLPPYIDADWQGFSRDEEAPPEEIKGLIQNKKILSEEASIQKAMTYFPTLKNTMVENKKLFKTTDSYIWELNLLQIRPKNPDHVTKAQILKAIKEETVYNLPFDSLNNYYLLCNALTGEVLTYSNGNREGGSIKEVKDHKAKAQVTAFLEKIAPDALKACQYKSYPDYTSIHYFVRQVEGTPVAGNGFTVEYDESQKQITYYRKQWYPYPIEPIKNCILPEQVAKYLELTLYYVPISETDMTLAYRDDSREGNCFSAITGERLDRDGHPIK